MEILTILSLGYLGILVLTLAGSLSLILYYLWQVRSVLSDIGEALTEVEAKTELLEPRLAQLHDAVEHSAQQVSQARNVLVETS